MVGERYFDQIIAWVIFSADKVYKLVHIPIDRHRRRGQVLGLSDHSLPTSECSRGVISPLTTPRGESTDDALMQLEEIVLRDRYLLNRLFDEAQGMLDILDLLQVGFGRAGGYASL